MNILENIPYSDVKMSNRKIVDEKHLLVMQIALKPGQSVPQHNANSHVHLLVMRGALTVNLDGVDNQVREGDLLPVAYQTPMIINNSGSDDATFLVFKTPNPSEMRKELE
ncbi:MAG: cupin domain-containing protein [Candidatus Omnitrophica bacterium]|nr:cupin domain-containing protein [Candidatus Omnitrophota bacterium]